MFSQYRPFWANSNVFLRCFLLSRSLPAISIWASSPICESEHVVINQNDFSDYQSSEICRSHDMTAFTTNPYVSQHFPTLSRLKARYSTSGKKIEYTVGKQHEGENMASHCHGSALQI